MIVRFFLPCFLCTPCFPCSPKQWDIFLVGSPLLSTDLGLSHTPRAFREQHDIFADLETQIKKREDS
jgi:hypothetical protein